MPAERATKPIVIACPEHNQLVRGTYHCDEHGRFLRGRDGGFLIRLLRCSQLNGRCAQTLCALHRHNRRGPHTWVPDRIFCMPQPDQQDVRESRVSTSHRRQKAPDLF
ncbi:MAG: hypothetical protein ACOCZU_05520 [Planctomycetota bacterium]